MADVSLGVKLVAEEESSSSSLPSLWFERASSSYKIKREIESRSSGFLSFVYNFSVHYCIIYQYVLDSVGGYSQYVLVQYYEIS